MKDQKISAALRSLRSNGFNPLESKHVMSSCWGVVSYEGIKGPASKRRTSSGGVLAAAVVDQADVVAAFWVSMPS